MVSLSGLIPCNTPRMAVAGISATASSSNALHLPISRIAVRYPFNGEMAYSPHSIPAHYAGVLSPHRGRHFAPCPKNDKAGNTAQNASLRKHQAGKIRLVIGKNTGHQFDIRAVIVGQTLVPRPPNSLCPQLHCFYWRNMVVGNVQQTAIFIVTPRADKIVLRFFGHI